MIFKKYIYVFSLAILLITYGCCSNKKINPIKSASNQDLNNALPSIVIYKTKVNYSRLVPVGLSADKSQIVSYPHPKDVRNDSTLMYPVRLENNFWLDRVGIGTNVAFLGIGMKEYSELTEPLSLEEMEGLIIDNDPLLEMWNCGPKANSTEIISALNNLILNNNLESKCKKLVIKY